MGRKIKTVKRLHFKDLVICDYQHLFYTHSQNTYG